MDTERTLQRAPDGTAMRTRKEENTNSLSRILPRDRWSLIALGISLAQFIVVSALLAIILKGHLDNFSFLDKCSALNCYDSATPEVVIKVKAITVYHVLFILAEGFQFVLAVDAVLNSSMMQLLATTTFNVCLFGYSIMQWNQAVLLLTSLQIEQSKAVYPSFSYHKTNIWEYAVIGAMGLFMISWFVVNVKLYKVFGWSIFKELGADIAVRRRLTLYYIYMLLLKIDTFFFVGFIGQYLVLVLISVRNNQDLAWVNGGLGLIGAIILLFIAYHAVRRESNIMMTLMLLGLSGVMGYLVTRLVDIYVNPQRYVGSKISLTFFAVITIALCFATFVVAVLNFRNFGKGLIEQLKNRGGNTKNHFQLDEMGNHSLGRQPYNHNAQNSKWGLE